MQKPKNKIKKKQPESVDKISNVPDWLPNWRNKNEYPGKETQHHEWMWQFLRRNEEYQRLWAELIEPYINLKLKKFEKEAAKKAFEKRIKTDAAFRSEYAAILDLGINTPRELIEKRFNISLPRPPKAARPEIGAILVREHLHVWAHPSVQDSCNDEESKKKPFEVLAKLQPGEIIAWFNLKYEIRPQIEIIEKHLNSQKRKFDCEKKASRNRDYPFQECLRVLDAQQCGAAPTEIARELYFSPRSTYDEKASSDKVRELLKTAKRLRDNDYYRIIPVRE